ncbi:MAG: hypothetical protein HY017_20970 [Betaproteobacteria bacterium]|nr:hypothetical protein [Betaproteobacteria bacterium]
MTTYTVEVDPGSQKSDTDMTALMKSVATNGKGKYFAVSSGSGGASIVDALNQIFSEVQAVNSVFASTTLPVSVNVRGTNLNQVYIGVFRPDPQKKPRWFGNLKLYQLGLNTSTDTAFLADAAGNSAENTTTGFISGSSPSFWTVASSYWGYRTPEENGVGAASDKPDGDLVEKGGSAEQQRIDLATSQTARTLYTCTGSCVVTPPSPWTSAPTPGTFALFNTANANITGAVTSLALDARQVSPLTAFQTQNVTSIADRKSVSLSNSQSPVAVTSLSNGGVSKTITALTTSTPQAITALTGLFSSGVGITKIAKVSGKFVITTAAAHGFTSGTSVSVTGVSTSGWNQTMAVLSGSNLTSTTFEVNPSGNPSPATDITPVSPATTVGTATGSVTSVTATATVSGHGFVSGVTSVTIAGAVPTAFNRTGTVTVVDSDHFTYSISTAQGAATTLGTAAGNTNVARATVTAHGFSTGNLVTVTGATPTDYNVTGTTLTKIDNDTFTYPVTNTPSTASGTITATVGATTTVTATAPGHGFTVTSTPTGSVIIAGANPGDYNGTFALTNVPDANTFKYSTTTALGGNTSTSVTAAGGLSNTVTATAALHSLAVNDFFTIEGSTTALHNGTTFQVATVPNVNTFTYANAAAAAAGQAPSGTITVRPSTPRAFVNLPAHGYSTLDQITIAGASPAAYNVTDASITKQDNDNFYYTMASAPGANTGTAVTASKKTTTARASSVAHGFVTGDTVAIVGATPDDFNHPVGTITRIDNDTFTYTLPTAQGDATGTITASGTSASGAERDNVINWVRGADNFADENADLSFTDVRASIHGDVLHSRPAVINYNRFTDTGNQDNDVFVFYGSNDGVFRAVKGGFGSTSGQPLPGHEVWGFIPSESFGNLKRLRNDAPTISSSFRKNYFADGPIGVYTKTVSGKISGTGAKAYLYIAMRRGGRFFYALDVTDPAAPKVLWKKDTSSPGMSELGQTWSEPRVIDSIKHPSFTNPVLLFGAGYDDGVEDLDTSTISASDSSSVTTTGQGQVNRGQGRGIYMVDAFTGQLIWYAGGTSQTAPSGAVYLRVTGMDCAISSDITVLKERGGTKINRGYVGDSCGNVWRIDFNATTLADWTVTKLASLGVTGSVSDASMNADRRKFQFPPDVVYGDGFDAVLIGSGDREHPFETTVNNRFYMIKDKATGAISTVTGDPTTPLYSTITEATMFDATNNCLQIAGSCDTASSQTQDSALTQLNASSNGGWFIKLAAGEKTVGNAVSVAGTTFFNTNQPASQAAAGSCTSNLGTARQYAVSFKDAKALIYVTGSGGATTPSRSTIYAGGGFLPSPVPVVVSIGGKTVQAIVSGVSVQTPPGAALNNRVRKFWYKEIDG